MSDNLIIYKALSRPPKEALKKIKGGRLAGMSDVNPQWRIEMLTEQFGPCGIGWYYTITGTNIHAGNGDEKCVIIDIDLFVQHENEWSKPIHGVGGSMFVVKESSGLRTNDEAFKMATTDALSVAMKQLGVAADIYKGLWDGSKYKDQVETVKEVFDGEVVEATIKSDEKYVHDMLAESNLSPERKTQLMEQYKSKAEKTKPIFAEFIKKECGK